MKSKLLLFLVFSLSLFTHLNAQDWETLGPSADKQLEAGGQIAVSDNGDIYALVDNGSNRYKFLKKWNGLDWDLIGDQNTIYSSQIALDVNATGTPFIAFNSYASSKVNVQKYNGSFWETVGLSDLSSKSGNIIKMDMGAQGNPIVAYVEYNSTNTGFICSVKRFDNKIVIGIIVVILIIK